jgi:hypothetical protein
MADKKISALTSATTPLAGTEVLPIVQSGATVKVAVSDLTAGRAISATQITLTAGNVIPANGFGIDFSATPGTGTSELLADYEEGTWTVVATPSTSGSITIYSGYNVGSYTKIGRMVTVSGFIYVQSVSSPVGSLTVTGLPYAIIGGDPIGRGAGSVSGTGLQATAITSLALRYFSGDNKLYIDKFASGTLSALTGDVKADTEIWFTATYPAA